MATACGLLNSRPSTKLGAVAVRSPCCCKMACPAIREGIGLNMVWASDNCTTASAFPGPHRPFFIQIESVADAATPREQLLALLERRCNCWRARERRDITVPTGIRAAF